MKLSLLIIGSSLTILSVLTGCSSPGPDGGQTSTPAPASSAPAPGASDPQAPASGSSTSAAPPSASSSTPTAAPADACNWTKGSFACGSRSCAKETDFCDLADATFGAACKSIGGDGSTCPRCATVLGFYQCADGLTPTCTGDETTGITVKCE
jgi:hypothetical protein